MRSGCGAEFQAQATRDGDRVTLLLENSICAIAACGNCLYDTATALEESTRTYVERLEAMVDEQRLPSGDELIGEIERFLREGGSEGQRQN